MPEIEMLLRAARPRWPEPPGALEARILGALSPAPSAPSPRGWLRHAPRSRRLRLVAAGLVLAGSGAAIAAAIAGRSGAAERGVPASLTVGRGERVVHIGGFLTSPPAVAADRTGTVSLAWARAGRVVVSSRPRPGGWSSEQPLSDRGVRAGAPRLAAGTGGTVAVWRERILGRAVTRGFTLPDGRSAGTLTTHVRVRWRVAASGRDAAGRWSAPTAISPAFGGIRDASAPALAMTGAGDAIAGYAAAGRAWIVRRDGSGAWAGPQAISDEGEAVSGLTLATAPTTGWAVATWIARTDDPALGRRWRLVVARATPAGDWEEPTAVTDAAPSKPLARAAIGDEGEAVVAWAAGGTRAVTHARTGSWSAPVEVAGSPGPNYILDAPPVGIDAEGRALVAILATDGSRIARREPGGDWQPPALAARAAVAVSVVPDAAGGLVVLEMATRGASSVLRAFDRHGADRGSAPLTGIDLPLGLAIGADGTTAVVGSRDVRDTTDIEVAVAAGRGRP